MSHVSSIMKSPYPYRASLAELDTNGDGIVSQQELEISERPGLLKEEFQSGEKKISSTSSSVLAVLMKISGGSSSGAGDVQVPAASQGDADMNTAMAVYRNTYGQYDQGNVAA